MHPRRALPLAGLFSFLALAHADTATYLAKHRPAAELAGLAALSMRSARPHILADEKSDRIAIDGPPTAVRAALDLLGKLDVAPRALAIEIEVVSGKEVRWQARLAAFSGVTARASRKPAGKLAAVEAKATATWLDGRWDVRALADVTLEGGTKVSVRGQARVADGERAEVGAVEAAGERVELVVRVKGR
jgi:hypothetical protein